MDRTDFDKEFYWLGDVYTSDLIFKLFRIYEAVGAERELERLKKAIEIAREL